MHALSQSVRPITCRTIFRVFFLRKCRGQKSSLLLGNAVTADNISNRWRYGLSLDPGKIRHGIAGNQSLYRHHRIRQQSAFAACKRSLIAVQIFRPQICITSGRMREIRSSKSQLTWSRVSHVKENCRRHNNQTNRKPARNQVRCRCRSE